MAKLHDFPPSDQPKIKRSLGYRIVTNLTFWVFIAIVAGVLLGDNAPEVGKKMEVIGTTFIKIIKVFIPPIIFLTIVLGIAGMGDLKKVGRIGVKSLIYFEVVTTFALIIGIAVAHFLEPGKISHTGLSDTAEIGKYTTGHKPFTWVQLFTDYLTLTILGISIVTGIILSFSKKREQTVESLGKLSKIVFTGLKYVMYLAPLAAFGGIAYAVGEFGLKTLIPLGKLMGTVYLTMFLFVFVILGGILWFYKMHIWKVLKYIGEELLIVLGTSSSEAALPSIMQKLERMGCSKSVVGLVVPTGYSFNLDGTSIYLSMSIIFLAQFYGVDLKFGEMVGIIGILMLTSKGAAGVAGSGLIILGSTLAAIHKIPMEGIALMLGVDKFMSEARAITNLIGNTVATIVISKSEKEFHDPNLNAKRKIPDQQVIDE